MTQTIALQPWMTLASTQAVMNALQNAGGQGSARFVGGCVRDALLGRPVGDIDIATTLTPPQVIEALEQAALKSAPTGIAHGTITAVAAGKPFEITSLRRDVRTDGRRAVVAFTEDWDADAARRDFRLNALYLDREGALLDPTGEGISDAKAGRIIFVGDPAERIREDYLRILRFFRFRAWFGRGAADADALKACSALKAGVQTLSGERVAKELLKLMAAQDPRPAVELMAKSGVLQVILPEVEELSRFEALVAIETEQLFTQDPLLRLAALLPSRSGVAETVAKRLRLSNAQQARLTGVLAGPGEPQPLRDVRIVSWMSPREMRRAVYRLGRGVFQDRIKLAWAASERSAAGPQWRMLLVYADTWEPPQLPLSGEEIMAAGVPKGPLMSVVRREVEEWWVDLDFTLDKLAVLERLKAVAQGLAF